jgi:hypothetical protein
LFGNVGAGKRIGFGAGEQRWRDQGQWRKKCDFDAGAIAALYIGRAAIIKAGYDLQHFGKR